jgi:iron complex transport system ATP-binding protein
MTIQNTNHPTTSDIELNNICIAGHAHYPRINNVSCTFHSGEVIVIIGPNGAGKSSLLHALTGQLPYNQGQIHLFGRPLAHWPMQRRAQHVAFLPQKHQLSQPFLVSDIIALARLNQTGTQQQNQKIIRNALEAFDAARFYDRCYTELSGGEQQRVHLARVFAQLNALSISSQRPGLLLLDEPTTGLDLAHQQHLISAIRQSARNGLTVLASLHNLSLTSQLATRVLCLDRGEIKAFGTVTQVMEPSLLSAVFKTKLQTISPSNLSTPLLYLDYSTMVN